MQGLLAGPLGAGVDSLDDVPLQGLDAQLTEMGVNQPLHSLATGGQGKETTSPTTVSCSRLRLVGTFAQSVLRVCSGPGTWEQGDSHQHGPCLPGVYGLVTRLQWMRQIICKGTDKINANSNKCSVGDTWY